MTDENPMVEEVLAASGEAETYNGWKNYPTWCVNLWLSNDEGLYRTASLTVGDAKRHGDPPRVYLADMLKEMVLEIRVGVDNGYGGSETVEGLTGFHADLLGYALDQVDWFEIADAWLED